MKETSKILYLLLLVLAFAVNLAGINVNFFTDDPGLYASIAKNLVYKKDFYELFTYNTDWLDKPHFPFWAIMLSFKFFGISVWAYRLPALIFFMLGVIYTYVFTRKYYGWEISAIAVLILMTAQHVVLSNTDVRAEPYLMALLIAAIYHIASLEERYTFTSLLFASLFTACAVMTKGIFILIPIYGSLAGQLMFQRRIKHIFHLKWLWLLLLTSLFILPEFYALYTQFDLHPEKVVFGRNHVSGIKWFLWDSQFGRFINNGPITRNDPGSIFFYLHTLLWAFAPWCLLFYYAIFRNIKAIFNKNEFTEYYALSGGLLLLVLFSFSRFQLPFYTNAVFPLFAIITAPICLNKLNKYEDKFRLIIQWVFVFMLPLAIVILNFFLKPAHDLFFGLDCLLFGLIIFLITTEVSLAYRKVFFLNCAAALFAGLYLNTIFLNEIVPYKGQIAAAKYINQKPFDHVEIFSVRAENNIFQFYCNRPIKLVPLAQFITYKPKNISVFYVNQQSIDYLNKTHALFKIVKSFVNYPEENILPRFISKDTRQKTLDHVYLISK